MKIYTVNIDGVELDITQDDDGKFIAPEHFVGLGTALKPSAEFICIARKPLSEKTVALNVLRWGTGALRIDDCRVPSEVGDEPMTAEHVPGKRSRENYRTGVPVNPRPSEVGRWPATITHDGSEEVLAAFPSYCPGGSGNGDALVGEESDGVVPPMRRGKLVPRDDTGSAARFFASFDNGRDGEPSAARRYTDRGVTNFSAAPGTRREPVEPARIFYTSKADGVDRAGSMHPTCKPLDLIQYCIRLVTPKGGTTIDPFAGSGTAGEAAYREGVNSILIEREPTYCDDIRRRMALVMSGPDERARESMKASGKAESIDTLPLFGGESSRDNDNVSPATKAKDG